MEDETKLYFTTDLILLEGVKTDSKKHVMTGILIHPGKTIHPHEMIKVRQYFAEDLAKSAGTLVGKGIDEDHNEHPFDGCVFTEATWNNEEVGVQFKAEISDELYGYIKEGRYQGMSATMNWMRPGGGLRWVDGVAPYNFEFVRGSMITARNGGRLRPGDPKAYFKLIEAVELYRKKNGQPVMNWQDEKKDVEEQEEPKMAGGTAARKEDNVPEGDKAAIVQHENQSHSTQEGIIPSQKKFPLGEGSQVPENKQYGGKEKMADDNSKTKNEEQLPKEGDKVFIEEKTLVELTPETIKKMVDVRLKETLLAAVREKNMTALEGTLKEMETFISAAVHKGQSPEAARKEWLDRIEVQNSLLEYPLHIREAYTAKLGSSTQTAAEIKMELGKEWKQKDIDALPDTSFAFIAEGKRVLPFKDKDGKIVILQLTEAIDMLDKSGLTVEQLSVTKKTLREAAKTVEITSKLLDLNESEYLVDARKEIVDLKAQLADTSKQRDEAKTCGMKLAESILNDREIIPDSWVLRSWAMGPQKSVQALQTKLHEAIRKR